MAERTDERRDCLLLDDLLQKSVRRVRGGEHPAALGRLLEDAETALEFAPVSVLDKQHVPPTGDKRDYFSLSIYFWPDPGKPDGLPYVPRDGMVNPETAQYDFTRFTAVCGHSDTLALAYAFTGEERYAEAAARLIRTWFLDDRTGMRPNMLFAQCIPGENVTTPWKEYPARYVPGTQGRKGVWVAYGGVIEDCCLVPLTDTIRLLRPSRHWTMSDDAAMRQWYANYAQWLLTHQHGQDEAACRNNHGSWYWADIAAFLNFAGRCDEARTRVQTALPKRLDMQIEPDGAQPEELGRAISRSYVSFTLASFVNIAIAAAACGWDAWAVQGADGRSIRKAVDWMLPYLAGEAIWTWRQIKPADDAKLVGVLMACEQKYGDQRYRRSADGTKDLGPERRVRLIYGLY